MISEAKENRPFAERIATIEGKKFNNKCNISRLSDGSMFCDCLQFLYQKKVNNDFPFSSCKHIRTEMRNHKFPNFKFQAPSAFQKAYLKKLGVEVKKRLTNAQAYFILGAHLERQKLKYDEFEDLLFEHPKVNFLPLNYFDVEFEGGLGCSKEEFEEKLAKAGIESLITDYVRTWQNSKWEIESNSSISIHGSLEGVKVTSPKFSGNTGFEEITKVLKLWDETLPTYRNGNKKILAFDRTCGTHVHVDAHGWRMRDFLRLAKVWAKMEIPVIWYLVSPSRRNGKYCKTVDEYFIETLSKERILWDRYYSLAFEAYPKRIVGYRIHEGTLDDKKITSWIVFLLMLTDAVKKGLSHTDFEPTFDGVIDAVGMSGSNTTPLIKEAKNYLSESFQHWKEEERRNPPSSKPTPINIARIEKKFRKGGSR